MRVKAKVMLQYGIVHKEGTEFVLNDPAHFDEKVMEAIDLPPKAAKAAGKAAAPAAPAKKAEAPAAPTQPPAELVLGDEEGDEEPVTEEGDEQADGGDAANETDEGETAPAEPVAAPAQGGSSAPVQRRRSTAAQRGNA